MPPFPVDTLMALYQMSLWEQSDEESQGGAFGAKGIPTTLRPFATLRVTIGTYFDTRLTMIIQTA